MKMLDNGILFSGVICDVCSFHFDVSPFSFDKISLLWWCPFSRLWHELTKRVDDMRDTLRCLFYLFDLLLGLPFCVRSFHTLGHLCVCYLSDDEDALLISPPFFYTSVMLHDVTWVSCLFINDKIVREERASYLTLIFSSFSSWNEQKENKHWPRRKFYAPNWSPFLPGF